MHKNRINVVDGEGESNFQREGKPGPLGLYRKAERKGKERKGKKMSRGGLQELRILLDIPCTGL